MLPSTYTWSPGDTVHLVNRGVHKDPIFRDSDDCNYFRSARLKPTSSCTTTFTSSPRQATSPCQNACKTSSPPTPVISIPNTASQATCSRQNATPASSEPTPNS